MGSQSIQGQLWGKRADDWASIQEKTGMPGYEYALKILAPSTQDMVLDVGCGSGVFSDLIQKTGATVTGVDATAPLIEIAKRRNKEINFLTGEMEELPFGDEMFTIVSGFNSFQYAANVKNALSEAYRVLKPRGKIVAMIWGQKEDCEAAATLKAIGSVLPSPPPGAPGPFALTENRLLEKNLEDVSFKILTGSDVVSVWDYQNIEQAMTGLLSTGPAARAIDHSGYEKTYDALLNSVKPFQKENGHVVFNNKFRVVIAEK